MKKELLKIILLYAFIALTVFVLVLMAGCSVQKSTKSSEATQSQTNISANSQTETNSEKTTTSQFIGAGSVDLEIDENEINIKLSPPDSTGAQYPIDITVKGKKLNLKAKKETESNKQTTEKSNTNEQNNTNLQQNNNTKTDIKTDTKIGLSLLEKIGIGAVILLVLIVVYFVVKWYLKRRTVI